MSLDYILLGERIQEIRKIRGMKQYVLAEKAGLSSQYISQVETCRKQLSLPALLKISEALNVTADRLLFGNQQEMPFDYMTEFSELLEGCGVYEKHFIYEIAAESKRLLGEYQSISEKHKSNHRM